MNDHQNGRLRAWSVWGGLGLALMVARAPSAHGQVQVGTQPTPASTRAGEDEPRSRYNALLAAFRARVGDGGVGDAAAADAGREFVAQTRRLPGGVAYLADVSSLLAAIESVLGGARDDRNEASALAGSGPGSTGVYRVAEVREVGKGPGGGGGALTIVRYEPIAPASRARALEFVRVERSPGTGEGGAVYIQTTELSIGQAVGLVRSRGIEDEFLALCPPVEREHDARLGVRTWDWPGDRAERAARPMIAPSPAWPDAAKGPTRESPITHVSLSTAVLLARAGGCRLPTSDEWRAAAAVGTLVETPNLRDASWLSAAGGLDRPAGGSFAPGEPSPDAPWALAPANDGVPWFAEIQERSAGLTHLIGNVAEWAIDVPANPASSEGDGVGVGWSIDARGVAAAGVVRAWSPGAKIMGASAISDPALDPRAGFLLPADWRDAGFSDVGVRLAFSAPGSGVGRSIAQRLSALAGAARELRVR